MRELEGRSDRGREAPRGRGSEVPALRGRGEGELGGLQAALGDARQPGRSGAWGCQPSAGAGDKQVASSCPPSLCKNRRSPFPFPAAALGPGKVWRMRARFESARQPRWGAEGNVPRSSPICGPGVCSTPFPAHPPHPRSASPSQRLRPQDPEVPLGQGLASGADLLTSSPAAAPGVCFFSSFSPSLAEVAGRRWVLFITTSTGRPELDLPRAKCSPTSDPTGARVPTQARSWPTLARPFPLGAADTAFPASRLSQLLLPLERNISCYCVCLCPERLPINVSHCLFTWSAPKAPQLLFGGLKNSACALSLAKGINWLVGGEF